jgi:hypothetical protein
MTTIPPGTNTVLYYRTGTVDWHGDSSRPPVDLAYQVLRAALNTPHGRMRPQRMRRGSILIGSDVFRCTGLFVCSLLFSSFFYRASLFRMRESRRMRRDSFCTVQIGRTANIIANRRSSFIYLDGLPDNCRTVVKHREEKYS